MSDLMQIWRFSFGRVLSYIILVLLIMPGSIYASGSARVSDLALINGPNSLLSFFKIENAFSPEMEKGVQNGIPLTFTFYIALSRVRTGWPDEEIISHAVDHTLTYETLKERYRLVLQEKRAVDIFMNDFAKAKRQMTAVNGFPLVPLDLLEKGIRYRLRVKARLSEKKLPLNFHSIIPFWSLWDFETEWQELEFLWDIEK